MAKKASRKAEEQEAVKTATAVAEEATTAAPDALVPPRAANMAGPRPVPRLRGDGPVCPKCGSGMVTYSSNRTNHPFIIVRYFRCKNPKCDGTAKLSARR